jgi:hypothetical protein
MSVELGNKIEHTVTGWSEHLTSQMTLSLAHQHPAQPQRWGLRWLFKPAGNAELEKPLSCRVSCSGRSQGPISNLKCPGPLSQLCMHHLANCMHKDSVVHGMESGMESVVHNYSMTYSGGMFSS